MRLHSSAGAKPAFDQLLVQIPSRAENHRFYLTWQPIEATVSVPAGDSGRKVRLRNASSDGGTLVFSTTRSSEALTEMPLTLVAGTPASFWIAGATASSEDGDAVLEIIDDGTKKLLATVPMMVRIRKNANLLTPGERERLVNALARMNGTTTGTESTYRIMRNVHQDGMQSDAHHNPAFLPWHRAYVLEFERKLQAFDQSVALPYWRFDEPAPNVFTRRFLGARRPVLGIYAVFASDNPLRNWVTDAGIGIRRRGASGWNPGASGTPMGDDQAQTMAGRNNYFAFREMERNPHDVAHGSWRGALSDVPTAARDPIFFMLHANVDRLWALWQSGDAAVRMDAGSADAFISTQLPDEQQRPLQYGHHINDTMWPWNNDTTVTRALEFTFSAGKPFQASRITPNVPPNIPAVCDMIDYQAFTHQGATTAAHLGFDYDDVPFKRDS